MSKLSFRARALDASKPMPIYLAEELPDLPDYSAINRAVPQMPSGMEKEEESEHHLQRAISGTGLIIPTPEVCQVSDIEFYERCYPPDYKMPKQHIHMQPLWEEQEAPDYDLDTEDEQWLKQRRHPELTELKFEQMMDKLEKSSGQTVVTLNEAKLLLERNDETVIAVYDYWLNKRLTTQHPLILSVKTENRPGQSTNNPYLAFRRRTEKMQTRKNRKNDESSYEKMLKLRRDLARALNLLELVARRERAKRELVKLTALLAERRYAAGDFANQLVADPPPRLQYSVPLTSGNFRRETYTSVVPHYPPRPPPTPVDQPRQREKRTYKRRKHRHAAVGSAQGLRDSGVYTSSEEESPRTEPASPPDDGPFAFRRKPGCYYEMPTSTLCGDPVDPNSPSKEGMYQHEIDPRHRYTLTSIRVPYQRCIGFARRRIGRGGRLILDRVATPLDDLWHTLPFPSRSEKEREKLEEMELETQRHRTPKEITRDYHTSGKYPWRHAFRRHLARHPDLWISEVKPPEDLKDLKFEDLKPCPADVKISPDDTKLCGEVKMEPMDLPDLIQDSVKSDTSVRTVNVSDSGKRKRSWSDCSDSSYDSDESLQPVEKEFEKFIDEVNKKWLHFRPKTPPPSPPPLEPSEDQIPITPDTAIAVELRAAEKPPSDLLDTFTTSEFTLGELYPDIQDVDNSGTSLEISGDDLLPDDFTGLTEDQVESILSETDLKALAEEDDKKITDDLLEEIVAGVDKEPFLLQGQSAEGRADSGPRKKKAENLGSSSVRVVWAREPLVAPAPADAAPATAAAPPAPPPRPRPHPSAPQPALALHHTPPKVKAGGSAHRAARPAPAPVPPANIIVEEVNELPHKYDAKRKEDTVEEVQLSHGVQLKTVQTVHSPLKKHIITSGARARDSRPSPHSAHTQAAPTGVVSAVQSVQSAPAASHSAPVTHPTHVTHNVTHPTHVTHSTPATHQPQIVTVAVSDSLKVRLQNHLLSSQSGVLVQNGPFPPVVAVPVQSPRDSVTSVSSLSNVSVAGTSARRVSTPLVHLAPAALSNRQFIHPHPHTHAQTQHTQHAQHAHNTSPVVVAQSHTIHHVAPNKLKVLHAHPLTQSQRTQLLAQNRNVTQLPTVVSLATLGEAKTSNALLKAPGSVTQLFEIKSGQLGKGPHLVNVVRQPQPGKTTVTRLDLNDKKRQVVFDGTLKGNIATTTRPHRVSVSLDGRQIVRTGVTAIPAVRAAPVRTQFQLKNRIQVASPQIARNSEPSTSITIAPTKTASIPSSVVTNLLQKNIQLPKGGQKIAISSGGGQALSANVQAIAFSAAHVKARQARLIAQPRPQPVAEIVEASTAPVATTSQQESVETGDETETNGTVRRRTQDSLPMEVT